MITEVNPRESFWYLTIDVTNRLRAESNSTWAFCRPEFFRILVLLVLQHLVEYFSWSCALVHHSLKCWETTGSLVPTILPGQERNHGLSCQW